MFRPFRPSFEGLEKREVFSAVAAFIATENSGLLAGTLGRGVVAADFNGDARTDLAARARQAQAIHVTTSDFEADGAVDGADFLAARANALPDVIVDTTGYFTAAAKSQSQVMHEESDADDTNNLTDQAHDAFFSALDRQGASIWINQAEMPLAAQDASGYFILPTELPAMKSVVSDPSDQGVIYFKSNLGPTSPFRNGGSYSNIAHTYDADLG